MSLDRRTLIKAMLWGGAVSPLAVRRMAWAGPVVRAAACAQAPLLVLLPGDGAGVLFLQGVLAAAGSTAVDWRVGASPEAILRELVDRSGRGGPLRVVGLLEDAAAAPVLSVARSLGLATPWLGQHSLDSGGGSRHQVLTTACGAGRGAQLARMLEACGADFAVRLECQDSQVHAWQGDRPAPGRSRAGQWLAGLGWLLASPCAEPPPPRRVPRTVPATGAFASFVMEA